jgi:hypothetical protein
MKRYARVAALFLITAIAAAAHASNPSAVIDRLMSGAHVPRGELYQTMLESPNVFREHPDPAVKQRVFKEAGTRLHKDDAEDIALKNRALQQVGWFDEWLSRSLDELHGYASEGINGSFTHDEHAKMLLAALEEAGVANTAFASRYLTEKTRFLGPYVLMRPGFDPDGAITAMQQMPASIVASVEQELLASPPAGYWLSGAEWQGAPLAAVGRLFPQIYAAVTKECTEYGRNRQAYPQRLQSANICVPTFIPHFPDYNTSSGD